MTQSLSIRVARPDDRAAVTALLEASYPKLMAPAYEAGALVAALPLMARANPDLLASGTYYLAENPNGMAIGCGGWTFARPGDAGGQQIGTDLAHIRHFATHPDWTGCGVGRALYRRCEAEARGAGAAGFEAFSSLNAEPFYAALGFETVERFNLMITPDISLPSVRMRRTI